MDGYASVHPCLMHMCLRIYMYDSVFNYIKFIEANLCFTCVSCMPMSMPAWAFPYAYVYACQRMILQKVVRRIRSYRQTG